MKNFCVTGPALLAATLLFAPLTRADTFGSGEFEFEIPFVTIGSPGNAPDTTGAPNPAGAVAYTYRIGKYEVPEEAIRKANALSELAGDPLNISLDERGPQKPATSVSWFEAARFVNWLNEQKGFAAAYKFDDQNEFQLWEPTDAGYNPRNLFRNSLARYVLPSVDEWYKAAFYDPAINDYWDYPTGSDDPPTPVASGTALGTAVYQQQGPADVMLAGGASPFGSVGQAGNVNEWEETALDLLSDQIGEQRSVRGRDWTMGTPDLIAISLSSASRNRASPGAEPMNVGFRIVSVPDPATNLLLSVGLFWAIRLRLRDAH